MMLSILFPLRNEIKRLLCAVVVEASCLLSSDSKQDASNTNAHRKRLIPLLKDKKLLTTSLIKIWENSDGCAEQ